MKIVQLKQDAIFSWYYLFTRSSEFQRFMIFIIGKAQIHSLLVRVVQILVDSLALAFKFFQGKYHISFIAQNIARVK